jgi:tRNA A37 methylthiotransferase MiaB
MEGQVSEKDKRRRRDAVMKAQQGVINKTLPQMIGQRIPVLIEGPHSESDLLWSGRAAFQAPEVDGEVIINDVAEGIAAVAPGQIRSVEITEIAGYDLVGVVIE